MGKDEKAVFISVGDHSGDLHASNLIKEMRRREPDIAFAGFGLDKMLEAGFLHLDVRAGHKSAMWLRNVLNASGFYRRLSIARKFFRTNRPGLVILVDYGGFNLFLAREAAGAGIPVLYYIIPQVWAHGRYRLKKMRKWVDRAAVIYPFEPGICDSYGLDARYVGHPLFDELQEHPTQQSSVSSLKESYGENLIAVFPGSRKQEVRANLPVILRACRMLGRVCGPLKFAVACPHGPARDEADVIIGGSATHAELTGARPAELAKAAMLCLTKSGTITLEIASQNTPMVILYRVSPFLYFIISGMTHTPHAGIVNALAGETICPEKVMWRSDPRWLCEEARRLIEEKQRYRENVEALRALIDRVGAPGATSRTADIAFDMMV